MIIICSKLEQKKYVTRPNWVGKVIYWEMCKIFNLDSTIKWYMLKPESAQENETRKILQDFEIQMDHLTPVKRPDLEIIHKKKKIYHLMHCTISVDPRVKVKESEKINKYLDLARELKKTVGHTGDGDTNCSWCTQNDSQKIGKVIGTVRNQGKNHCAYVRQLEALLRLAKILRRVLET